MEYFLLHERKHYSPHGSKDPGGNRARCKSTQYSVRSTERVVRSSPRLSLGLKILAAFPSLSYLYFDFFSLSPNETFLPITPSSVQNKNLFDFFLSSFWARRSEKIKVSPFLGLVDRPLVQTGISPLDLDLICASRLLTTVSSLHKAFVNFLLV